MADQKYLLFKISDYSYSIPIENISRVIDTLQSRSFPLIKQSIEGLFVFDNQLIPMLKFSENLGIISSNVYYADMEESVIIAKAQNYFFGFRVDEVEGIISLDSEYLQSVENHENQLDYLNLSYSTSYFFDGKSNVLILDVEKLLQEILEN